jgi:hypothetical protein
MKVLEGNCLGLGGTLWVYIMNCLRVIFASLDLMMIALEAQTLRMMAD